MVIGDSDRNTHTNSADDLPQVQAQIVNCNRDKDAPVQKLWVDNSICWIDDIDNQIASWGLWACLSGQYVPGKDLT